MSAFYALFQHWNVRTPRWLGYIIQRPESHGLHHELGVHARNYSDFPLWDILMGTFVNPASFDGDVGEFFGRYADPLVRNDDFDLRLLPAGAQFNSAALVGIFDRVVYEIAE